MTWNRRIPTEFKCEHCAKIFTKLVSSATHIPKRSYCSNECRRSDKNSYTSEWSDERRKEYGERFSGENNPNYNKRWSDEKRTEFSEKRKEICKNDPELRYSYGNANRGKKFSPERIRAMHENRDFESYSRPHTEESKRKIGVKSREKWTDEFKAKFKETMISNGHWREQLEDYELYYKESNWIERMVDYATADELAMIKSVGIFNAENSRGCVRDHIVSRSIGYDFGIPYYILRHPENCQFILHSDNIRKGFSERGLNEGSKLQMIEDLLTRIENSTIDWCEKDACIAYIMQRKEAV